jgi:lysophospholipase L1-like esterase
MPTLLTFGDSNTHGSPALPPPGPANARFDHHTRWPCVAHQALGPDWQLVEEGLPGRTAQFDDPVMGAHMNGRIGLRIALCSHGPIDVMTLMLGTNDVKARFSTSAEQVASGIAGLLDIATGEEMQTRHGGFRILLICPPPVIEVGPYVKEFTGGAALSRALPPLYATLARTYACGYLDAGQIISVHPDEGVHYGAAAHRTLGLAVAGAVRALV